MNVEEMSEEELELFEALVMRVVRRNLPDYERRALNCEKLTIERCSRIEGRVEAIDRRLQNLEVDHLGEDR
jgi:hypothetical protein